MKLKEKSALITGAGSGIGKAIAEAFAREGAFVVIADLNFSAAQAVSKQINSAGGRATPTQMDVADEDQVNAGFEQVVRDFGGVDVLVNNAGIQIINPIVDFSLADWRKLVGIHLDGSFLATRAAMRAMISNGRGGTILYMGSVHSHIASPNKSAYVAAKHGVLGLAKAVAKEGAKHGIRSNVICPGFVRTPLVEKQIPEQAQQLGITEEEVIKNVMLRETVDGEFTSTEDVAATAVFLASFPSNALTGQSIVVTHGWFMHSGSWWLVAGRSADPANERTEKSNQSLATTPLRSCLAPSPERFPFWTHTPGQVAGARKRVVAAASLPPKTFPPFAPVGFGP